jgi:Ca-activated chloride channel family protein
MRTLVTLALIALSWSVSIANGVAIVEAGNGVYLQLTESFVSVTVENQIAITKTTQVFKNQFSTARRIRYAFPMPASASAVKLRRQSNGLWYEANLGASAQDTILTGGGGATGINVDLKNYLGATPLYFTVLEPVEPNATITIELTYVEFLPYENGVVSYSYPANYESLEPAQLELQHFDFQLSSGRKIKQISFVSHPAAPVTQSDHAASLAIDMQYAQADSDFKVEYELSPEDLGLFDFSVFLSDTLGCDNYGNGFCAFVVEPNPNPNADVIPKVFTLIIDKSGSMLGSKIQQAKDAATFIVDNLNVGDKFNIIAFSSGVSAFKPDHVDYNVSNQQAALNYITSLSATGTTNISGAFSTAIQQFNNDLDETYNIIIFFTDGLPTAGVTSTDGILNTINNLVIPLEKELSIFTFGVGDDVNKPLLTTIALQNNGAAQFLDNNELASSVSEFYETVRNPVLLHTDVTFDPNVIYETYPVQLPNLYKGSQMIIVGRYNEPGTVNAHFSGTAFGSPVSYQYPIQLSDKDSLKYRFLPKIWAKQKASHLLQQYHATSNAGIKEILEEEIRHLSTCYGVVTDLTSFVDNTNGGTISVLEIPDQEEQYSSVRINAVSPNPAYGHTSIYFSLTEAYHGEITIELRDMMGKLVGSWKYPVSGTGDYTFDLDIDKGITAGVYRINVSTPGSTTGSILIVR